MSQPSGWRGPSGAPPGYHDGAAGFPAPNAWSDYSGTAVPPPPTSSTLGWVALVAGAISLIGSVVNALIVYWTFQPEGLHDGVDTARIALAFGFANGLLLWFLFGLWAIVQGLVALAQKRGAVHGVVGMVLGIIGPWTGLVLAAVLFYQAYAV